MKLYRVVVGGVTMWLTAAQCMAAGIDFSTLTGAIDLSTVVTAIVAVGALLMVPGVAKYGVKAIKRFFPS